METSHGFSLKHSHIWHLTAARKSMASLELRAVKRTVSIMSPSPSHLGHGLAWPEVTAHCPHYTILSTSPSISELEPVILLRLRVRIWHVSYSGILFRHISLFVWESLYLAFISGQLSWYSWLTIFFISALRTYH